MENEYQEKRSNTVVEGSGAVAFAGGVAAGAGGYAAGRDINIYNQIKREPESIPPIIQSVLKKGITTEGNFFKQEPEWIDYQQGFIVERKEVNEIKKRLKNDKVQLVLGGPASGKSVIMKNVGFRLANDEKRNVYVVELKKHPKEKVKLFFENIPKIDDAKPIFIVDDAHLYLADCERFIEDFEERGKGNLIIGSREIKEVTEGYLKKVSEFKELNKTCIRIIAEDVTEKMIETFLRIKHNFSDERINTVSKNLEKYKKDLWLLSWALKAYNPKKDSVEEEEIYKNVRDSIRNIDAVKDKPPINAEDVFLPLSVFYRFEIPIERKFLEKQIGIDESLIESLIGLSEIVKTEEIRKPVMLSLNHSSIADLYLITYKNYPSLGEKIKEKILRGRDEEDLIYWSFYQYMTTTDIMNAMEVMNHLRRDRWDEKGGAILLEKLVNDENVVQKLIGEKIEKKEDIQEIGVLIQDLVQVGRREVARSLFYHININILLFKIEKEEDIQKIGAFILDVMETENREVARRLVDRINIDCLLSKIENTEDIQKIGMFVRDIVRTGRIKVAGELVDRIKPDALLSKIEKEGDVQKIGMFVADIDVASKLTAGKLVDRLNPDKLLLKIEKENDIEKIGAFVRDMVRTGRIELVGKLVDRLNPDILLSKIEKENDIEKIGAFVRNILWSKRKEKIREIINHLNLEVREELYKSVWWITIKAGID